MSRRTRDLRVGALLTLALSLDVQPLPGQDPPAPLPPINRLQTPQRVVVEIFRVAGEPKLDLEQTIGEQPVSLAGLFAPGGLQIEFVFNRTPLRAVGDSEDPAVLVELARARRPPPSNDHWYASIVIAKTHESGLLSMLPDSTRQTAIVYAGEHRKLGENSQKSMLLSAAHELTHIFNLHHGDWEGTEFSRDSTIEGYSLINTVRWHLSAASIEHLRHAPDEYVRPGGSGFGIVLASHLARHQRTPLETLTIAGDELAMTEAEPPAALLPPDVHARGPIIAIVPDLTESERATTRREAVGVTVVVNRGLAPLASISVRLTSEGRDRELRNLVRPDPDEQEIPFDRVELDPGVNKLVVTAVDQNGRNAIKERAITRQSVPGKVVAMVFGVKEYRNVSWLKYSLFDAQGIHLWLTKDMHVAEDNILYREEPDLATLRSGLSWLKKRADVNDTVVVYLSGHGAAESDSGGSDVDGLVKYFLPVDANPGDLYATALPMHELTSMVDRVRAGTVLVMLDTCFSGAAAGGEGRAVVVEQTRAVLDNEFLGRGIKAGRLILSASGANEAAREPDDLKHGVFTHFLLEGLNGAANSNDDRTVTVIELFEWVQKKVKEKTLTKQVPRLYGTSDDELPLWRAPN